MRRALRITAWTSASVLLLVVLLVVSVLIAGNTNAGRALLEREVTHFSGGRLRISGLSGTFPQAIHLEHLQLSDAAGPWLTAQQLSLRWSPLALLRRQIRIEELRLALLDIERRPASESSGGGQSHVPQIDLQQLTIDRLELGPELAGARASFSLQGTMHLKSLTDATARLTARRTDGQGDYELTAQLNAERMDAHLKLQEPASGPLENLLGYPGLGALSAQASLSGPRSAIQLALDARAGELRAGAHGTLDLSRQAADLDYDLTAPAMTPQPGLSWQRLSVHGNWHGPLNAPRANARLEVAALEAPGGVSARMVEATVNADRGTLELHGKLDGLTVPGPAPQLLAKAPLRIDATMQLNEAQRPLQLAVYHPLITLQARAMTAGARSVSFDLRLPDVAPLAAAAGQSIAGRSAVKGTLRQDATTADLEAEANSELTGGSATLGQLLGGASRLQLSATLTPRSLAIKRLVLNARRLTLSANGTAERGAGAAAPAIEAVHARYSASISDISALAPSIAGTANASGSVDGPLSSLAAEVHLTSNLSVGGAPRENLQADITARGLPRLTSATLKADGRFAAAPLQLDASLERGSADALHLTVHRAEWKSARLAGDVTAGTNLASGHGTLRLTIARLTDLQTFVGTSLAGSLQSSLELRSDRGRTDVRARLETQNLVAADLPANVLLTAAGPITALDLQLSVRAPHVHGEAVSIDSASRLNLNSRVLTLERADMHYHRQTLRLLAPARVSFADGLAIRSLKLGVQKAELTLDGRISPALDVQASVHHVDAALVNAFMPQTLAQGTFDANAHLEGKTSAPSGFVTVDAIGVRLANDAARDLHAVDLHARAQLAADSARLDARLSASQTSQLTLTGTAPLRNEGPLNLKLTGQLDVALANALLEAHGQRAAGILSVNATIAGKASSPEVSGTVDLTRGELRDYVQGIHLSDVSAHLVGDQGTLRVVRFTARAPPGELSMTGTLGVLQPKMPVDLKLSARNAQPVTSDILTTNLNADITVSGTLRERLQVSGSIDLHRSVIGVPNSMPPQVAVLDVRRQGQAPPPPPERKLVIALDLRLHAPREILVQGRGLNAELGGDLHITGTSDEPRVSGGFELIRGTFALAGSTLTFTKGEVAFNGAGLKGRIDPTLDFTAQSTVSDATATLHITGLADAPQFELSSSPALPQDEILARLLFGETASQLTVVQLAEIGAALATLGGVGGSGPNPLVRVQKALGLDRLSVGSSSSSAPGSQNTGTSVEAGRYVSNRVFVGAKQSTTGFSQVEVDVDMSKHLKLQTRLGNGTATTQGVTPENDPGSSVGLTYQFEY